MTLNLMSQLFARVFLKILDSSIAEDCRVRYVFEDFLKLGWPDGIVDITREALSRKLNVPLDWLNEAITKLEEPDPRSRNKAHDGRRLLRLDEHRDWGWKIANWEEYERIRTQMQANDRLRRHRDKKHNGAAKVSADPTNPEPDPNSYEKVPAATQNWGKAREVITHMNKVLGKSIPFTNSAIQTIAEALSQVEGDLAGCIQVVDHFKDKWVGTPQAEFLTVNGLFSPKVFADRYGERSTEVKRERPGFSSDWRKDM